MTANTLNDSRNVSNIKGRDGGKKLLFNTETEAQSQEKSQLVVALHEEKAKKWLSCGLHNSAIMQKTN